MQTSALRSSVAPSSPSIGPLLQNDRSAGASVVQVTRRSTVKVNCSVQPFEQAARKVPSKSNRVNAVTDYVPVRELEGHGGVSDKVVGVLGGGQLGRMLCQAASPLGLRVVILDPQENAPAAALATEHIVGSFKDPASILKLAERCNILTFEIEHVNVEALEEVEERGVDVEPRPATVAVIQDKYTQKVHFRNHRVPLSDFLPVSNEAEAQEACARFGFPLMVKSRRNAYDGRGNAVVHSQEGLRAAVDALGGYQHGLYAERWVPFVKELAVMVARSRDGMTRSFPVVETTHKDNICHTVVAPAPVPASTQLQARAVAEQAVSSLAGAGVFGVEMFLLPDGQVYLNEVAPRPHNSGHYTIEACCVSQYEQHMRAVIGLPLGDPSMKVGAAAMFNILGEADGVDGMEIAQRLMDKAMLIPGASVHWYGKEEVRKGRKVGHITLVGRSPQEVRRHLCLLYPAAAMCSTDYDSTTGATATVEEEAAAEAEAEASLSAAAAVSATSRGASSPSRARGTSPSSSSSNAAVTGGARSAAPSPAVGAAASAVGKSGAPLVSVIMGSDSDLPVMKAAAQLLEYFAVPYELTVVSAHRTPERLYSFASSAHRRGIRAIIAGAGGAAHLPGMVASMTPLPVIGVPVKGSSLDGMDSLLSIVQMPRGIPVATVAVNNAANAGLLAIRILASADPALLDRMIAYQKELETMVLDKASRLEEEGWESYLNSMSSD